MFLALSLEHALSEVLGTARHKQWKAGRQNIQVVLCLELSIDAALGLQMGTSEGVVMLVEVQLLKSI